MRALMLMLLAACAVPRDRLGDDRVIEKPTPLFTTVEPSTGVLRGTSVRMTAYVVDVAGNENVRMQVLRCTRLGTAERDRQCIASGTEEVLAEGALRREDELLIFEYDYMVPADLPLPEPTYINGFALPTGGYFEHVMFRTHFPGRTVLQEASLSVLEQEPPMMLPDEQQLPPSSMMPLTLFSVADGQSYMLQEGAVNTLPAGDFTFGNALFVGGGLFLPFFCTPGCHSPELPPNDFNQRLHLDAGASPRFYLLESNKFQRFVLQAAP